MMEQNIIKEEKEEGDFLSSINALEKNISLIRSKLEEEFSRKEKKHIETLQKTKEAVDGIISGYKKRLLEKDSEIDKIKSSVKVLAEGYEELILKKDEHIKNIEKQTVLSDENTKEKDFYEKKLSDIKEHYESKVDEVISKTAKTIAKDTAVEYKKRLLEKDSEIGEIKQSVKNLVSGYEELIKTKDEYLLNIQKEKKSEEISFLKLKSLGVPEEILSLSKEEILKRMTGVIKENHINSKKTDNMRESLLQKEEELETSKKAYEKNFKNLTLEYSKLLEKNISLEADLKESGEKTAFLSSEKAKEKDSYEKKILQLISFYEAKVNEAVNNKTRREIELEVSVSLLQKQLSEYQEKLSDKESRKEEFLKEVEETVKNTLNRKSSEFLKNYESE